MRRLFVVLVVLSLMTLAVPAVAQQLERHPHMLVLGLEIDESGEPVGFRKCVDIAASRRLPLNAHHEHLHTGSAGEMLFTKAGHVLVPGAPYPAPFGDPVPWSNCEELIAFFFGG